MTPTRPGLWVGGRWPGRTALPGSLLQPPQPARQEGRAFHLKAFSWHRRGITSSQWELGVRKRCILIGESGQMIKFDFFFHNLDFPFNPHMLFFCSCIMWQISRVTKFCHIRKHPRSLNVSLVSNLDVWQPEICVAFLTISSTFLHELLWTVWTGEKRLKNSCTF